MSENTEANSRKTRRRGPFQFGISTLLFLAIPVSLLCGAWATLATGDTGQRTKWFGLLLVAAAPVALAILTSLFLAARGNRK